MHPWPKGPLLYEVNTWVWIDQLSRKAAKPVSLASIPEQEWDSIASLGVDAVWLMGVWERSPESIRVSMLNQSLVAEFKKVLPDFVPRDNVGSPYSVRRYAVDEHLGGPEALAVARGRLADRGLRLVLDFVPNHVARDHDWVQEHPEYFIRGSREDLERDPLSFMDRDGEIYACGRDPYFPPWSDVLQLNAFDHGLRAAAIDTVKGIAGQCDGVRCDMAMLLVSSIFEKTWRGRTGTKPETDYWIEIIPAVKQKHPQFQFIAEAYWNMEWDLQLQGFDFCYDKRLYDRLRHEAAEAVRLHLCADLEFQEKLIRFIENHDEDRAASAFNIQKGRAAALTVLMLPGAKLLHDGQMEGRKLRLPVFLARRPDEIPDFDLVSFYSRLLKARHNEDSLQGEWRLCAHFGWPDNASYRNLVSWCWRHGSSRCLIAVNLSDAPAQGRIQIPWEDLRGTRWRLTDVFSSAVFDRSGDEMCDHGLYVGLPEWGFHFLRWQRI